MKRRTGLLSTKSWMRSWVTEELPISSSDMLSAVKEAVDGDDATAVRCTTAVVVAGEKAVVHDADDRRAVAKTMERIMMASMIKKRKWRMRVMVMSWR
jgi:hypothetical protein